ncbi:hypothetical protein AQI95_24320 [Streptomyces yokosukanensis]|uniref:Uncharacterized protein n=1 Tax=Streptomyces yokosukanensis TaxID=67386 RepID=A0A101P1B1_9ACTN|nr:hypothetical protein [Streptomyces yokosukanensis]KUN03092.1 hypothetical protein AQI95_24320 [Streptomyces yokosukanensis]
MSRTSTPEGADAPATLLGPTALGLGLAAAAGLCPLLTFGLLPVMLICGGLAVTFGLTGIHYARRGIGRLWTATTGTVLGAIGFVYPFVLFLPLFW